jgi:hypothetical protein
VLVVVVMVAMPMIVGMHDAIGVRVRMLMFDATRMLREVTRLLALRVRWF